MKDGMRFNILDFGAIGDGVTDDTRAVRAAMEAAAQAAGTSTVVFPANHTFRTGYVRIYSHTTIHLEAGSLWKASDRFDDFLPEGGHFTYARRDVPSFSSCDYSGGPRLKFIHALDAEDISFTGEGAIDGNEAIFYGETVGDHIEGLFYPRMPLLYMENVRGFTMGGITLQNSAFWTIHMVGCRDVIIDGVTIDNNLSMANCDGIDPDACADVSITNCSITSADDCIVLKTTQAAARYGPCRNIRVSGCTLRSKSAAFKIGSESKALFTEVDVGHCVIYGSNRALSLQLRDKGSIENVRFHDIRIDTRLYDPQGWWGKAEPVAITANRRRPDTHVGHIRGISFENISSEAEGGLVIVGDGQTPNIDGIAFSSCSFHLRRATNYPAGVLDIRPGTGNPLQQRSLRHVTLENAGHVRWENVTFTEDEAMAALMKAAAEDETLQDRHHPLLAE